MSSKQKFVKNLINLIALSIILYLTLFYIAPFVSNLTSRFLNTNQQINVSNIVLKPQLVSFKPVTNSNFIQLEGTTTNNVKVYLFLNNEQSTATDSNDEGKFKFENIEILKGKNTIKLQAEDRSGIKSDFSEEYQLDFDDKKPEIKEINLKDGQEIKNLNKNIKIVGEISEKSEIEVNGARVFNRDENKFEYLLGVEEGEVKIKIKIKDEAGNENEYEYKVRYSKSSN